MALLSSSDRAEGNAAFMRDCASDRSSLELTKANMRAAFDAADAWVDANSSSFNSALPVAARNALTASQKARLLMAVVRQRWVKGA